MGRKHCGKRRNCWLRAIPPFPTAFSEDLYCTLMKIRVCLGKGQKKAFKNLGRKSENGANQHFFPFSLCFIPCQMQNSLFALH